MSAVRQTGALPKGRFSDRICVAQIGAANGLHGEVRLRAFTEDERSVAAYGSLETADGSRHFTIEAVRRAKDHLLVRLSGIEDRASAAALRNLKLYVRRDRLPGIEEENTFYHADLIGLRAVDRCGTDIGCVTAVHNFGAGDLLEIANVDDGAGILLPFTRQSVPLVDIAAGRIVVDPAVGTVKE